ncbi:rCG39048 [Rattus norvegicus]|uniref:RCG39048 n=1 Tax=Rattus norvegicus TaxID=10116 RepID=A6JY50_RAT|nr:rCG39048 [Rattus norvegicus]
MLLDWVKKEVFCLEEKVFLLMHVSVPHVSSACGNLKWYGIPLGLELQTV